MPTPSHHLPGGRFRNPWPESEGDDAIRGRIRQVIWERITTRLPPNPRAGDLPIAGSEIGRPHAAVGEVRITWVGHATHLIQLPGLNLITDPIWSSRASPLPVGVRRFVAASPDLDALPSLNAVLLSHDHYDHLDRASVVALRDRFGDGLVWFTPLGYRGWFTRLGVERVVELDWWDAVDIPDTPYRVVATPARHWSRRTPWSTNTRLWSGWAVTSRDGGGPRVYFAGDSAYGSVFREIGRRLGPFHASVIPIGAYEPRWFMQASHMNPEEAVRVYQDVGGTGAFLPSHWGTFRLTFEDPLEPPARLRVEWDRLGLDPRALHVPSHGETVRISL